MSEDNKDTSVKTPYTIGMGSEALTEHDTGDAAPREGVHLYHFPISTCSQKVRMALEYKGVDVQYHPVMINMHEQHLPQYVKINPRCVVPALVVNGKVTTDSKNIIERLDGFFPDQAQKLLVPSDEEERKSCQHWTQLADEFPIHCVTFGTLPGVKKPFVVSQIMKESHDEEVAAGIQQYIDKHKDDPFLKSAYEEKLKVIQRYSKTIRTPEQMKEVMELVTNTMTQLNEQLAQGPFAKSGGFLCSQELCTADIEWCVLLTRMIMVGAGPLWVYNKEKLSHVGPYIDKLSSLACYKKGIKAFDSKAKMIALIASRKWNAAMGKETVL